MQFVIEADVPYRGHALSVIAPDGTVAYSGGLTVEQYEQRAGVKVRIVSSEEMAGLERAYIDSRITEPVEIDHETWTQALEVLPPARWHVFDGVDLFHISERITADLVDWFAADRGKFYRFQDRSGRPSAELAAKVRAARDAA